VIKSYYIVFETKGSLYWRIIETNNDLDTSKGLQKEISNLESGIGESIILLSWKTLKKPFADVIKGIFKSRGKI
jgi:hypothetical protein